MCLLVLGALLLQEKLQEDKFGCVPKGCGDHFVGKFDQEGTDFAQVENTFSRIWNRFPEIKAWSATTNCLSASQTAVKGQSSRCEFGEFGEDDFRV
jgi:hypothetical protein